MGVYASGEMQNAMWMQNLWLNIINVHLVVVLCHGVLLGNYAFALCMVYFIVYVRPKICFVGVTLA